ncbi:MAG: carbamoyltransferase HypF, partial [Caulobacterales bacterium]
MLRVRGTVQGVGFRPFVHVTAERLGLRGWVRNDPQGVLIRATGDPAGVDALVEALQHRAPPAALVSEVIQYQPDRDTPPAEASFPIIPSELTGTAADTAVPPELALCPDCRRELLDPRNRRHRYPFINCTQCGPRYSLVESLPYDRPRTTMREFQQCPDCQREYDDPRDRRFHAQPNACPVCGPRLRLTDPFGRELERCDDALRATVLALTAGRIVAVKGLGGFHLMCDATNEVAVAELRRRKHREEKPFAVMFRDLAALRQHAEVGPAAARLLGSAAAPVVLVTRRPDSTLAAGLAPANPWLGALLPYTPLHVLLTLEVAAPLVATSANLSEEPLCTDDNEAHERLAGIADLFLGHNRAIANPVDDSVVRLGTDGHPVLLRRARGYAPAPLSLPADLPAPLLCVGAQMKNTIGVAAGNRLVLSPHLGDLANAATHRVFERTIGMLGELHGSSFAAVAHDLHPDYTSTGYARRTGLPCIPVQHHLAHVLACLLEHSHPADGVLGIAWDGTGCGEDGTIWGGEFILLQQNRATRFARLRPFRLPGGEAAVRDSRRAALGLLHAAGRERFDAAASGFGFGAADTGTLAAMLASGLNSPWCSSAGRLFDAVGALLGLNSVNTFEGQTPLAVEAAAWSGARDAAALPLT